MAASSRSFIHQSQVHPAFLKPAEAVNHDYAKVWQFYFIFFLEIKDWTAVRWKIIWHMMSNPIRVNQKTWLTKMSACKTMNKTWIAFRNGTIIFHQDRFFLPYTHFFTSYWITMHSHPAEQTNHSPTLMFLSHGSPESLRLARSFFLLHSVLLPTHLAALCQYELMKLQMPGRNLVWNQSLQMWWVWLDYI